MAIKGLTRAMVKKAAHDRRVARELRKQGLHQGNLSIKEQISKLVLLPVPPLPRIKVMDEWKTLQEIILNGKSIARYGDGELKHMNGRRNVSQVFHDSLQARLTEVYHSRRDDLIIGIPYLWNGRQFPDVSEDYIKNTRRRFAKISDRKHTYGSSYITRGDLCGYLTWPSYWSLVFEVWRDRNVTLVCGNEKRANTGMMKAARSIHVIKTPSSGAWKEYDRIMVDCLLRPKSDLFLLCVGPTATVLAHDLASVGRQALDIGHLGLFYRRHWGIEDMSDRQVWHHRPTDPEYIPGAEY